MRSSGLWLLLLMLVAFAHAEDRPSWSVIDAADRLIAKHALFMPGGDGFLKHPSGLMVQYERPSKSFVRDEKGWIIEIQSPRWREESEKGWQPWNDARPRYDTWRIGVIRVDVPISGVKASWVDNTNFVGRTPPSQTQVMHRLNTLGQMSARTAENQPEPPAQVLIPETHTPTVRPIHTSQGGGIFRKRADGSLQPVSPQQAPPTAAIPEPAPATQVAQPRVVPVPTTDHPQQVHITHASKPPSPVALARLFLPIAKLGWIFASMTTVVIAVFGIGFWLLRVARKTNTPASR